MKRENGNKEKTTKKLEMFWIVFFSISTIAFCVSFIISLVELQPFPALGSLFCAIFSFYQAERLSAIYRLNKK